MADVDGTTATFRYANLICDFMWSHAQEITAYKLQEYGYPATNLEETRLVYVGNVRSEASVIGLSPNTAGDGMALLNAMRCVTLLKPGGPRSKSIYLLDYKITLENYDEFRDRQGTLNRRIKPSKWDTMLNDMAQMKIDQKQLAEKIEYLEGLVIGLHSKIHGDSK
jgi:hypothetical protein